MTINAMGCQREIARLIVEQEANYVLAVKRNQSGLFQNIERVFKEAIRTKFSGFESSCYHRKQFPHGREETRYYLMLSNI